MATFSDFTTAEEVALTQFETVTSTAPVENSIILGYLSHYDFRGSTPSIQISGVNNTKITEISSTPYRLKYPHNWYYRHFYAHGYYPTSSWLGTYYSYFGNYYYSRYWRYYHYRRLWYVNSTMVIYIANEAGTVSMQGDGATFIEGKLKVLSTNISPAAGKSIESITWQESKLVPSRDLRKPSNLRMEVKQDDLVLAVGHNFYSNTIGLSTSGPTTQTLLDEVATYNTGYSGGTAMKLMRVKADGNIAADWTNSYGGTSMIRLTPNVAEVHDIHPAIATSLVYFELQVEEDAGGNINYNRETLAVFEAVKNTKDWGLFRGWKREVTRTQEDDVGGEANDAWRRVEIFGVPTAHDSLISQIPDANVLENEASLLNRIDYHDEGWI